MRTLGAKQGARQILPHLHTPDRRSRYHLEDMLKGSRAVVYVAGAGLVATWLAAAADRRPDANGGAPAGQRDSAGLARAEHLAQEIQAQATRLRAHLAAAPQPTPSGRNPFTFESRETRIRRGERVRAASVQQSLESAFATSAPEPPPLTLSGVAEESSPAGNSALPVRIAVLSGYGDVFLARTGDTIASRYQVIAVGADAVELKDLLAGQTIRLGLR
jgi:hypothetical protein